MTSNSFDLVVIGGGPGGYVGAIRAAQLGLRVALVEREHLGGICLNWGCIPTKSLLHAADVWRRIGTAGQLGISIGNATFDYGKVIERSRAVAAQLNNGVRQLLKKNKVKVFAGSGRLAGQGRVIVTDAKGALTLSTRNVIIATGARPRELPDAPCDGERVWNYRHALSATALPSSLLIVGAGAIGMEFASLFATFGTRVIVAEAMDRVLPTEDDEVSAFVAQAYRAQGIELRTGVAAESIRTDGDGVVAMLREAGGVTNVQAKRALIAIGVIGNTEELGLEGSGVEISNGRIVIGPYGATGAAGIYAIGDVAGPPWLAHKAMHEAIACVEHIAGKRPADAEPHGLEADKIPSCMYGHPQTASIGLTERAAAARGRLIRVGRFPFRGNGKAIALGEPEGFVKTVFDAESGELLGAHCVGPDVTELIHSLGVARGLEATEDELMQTIFPHPTLSESLHESVLAAFDRALHI